MPDNWFGKHRGGSLSRAGGWAFGGNFLRAVIQLLSAVVLSRLLPPEDFGTFAIMMVLYALITPLIGRSFSTSLIQKQELSEQEASNFFWVAFAISGAFGVALALSGPALAWFFGDPVLTWLALVFAGLVWLDSIGAQYTALMMRSLRFDIVFRIQVIVGPVAFALGVVSALAGLGVWALVINMCAASVLNRVLLVRAIGWKPRRYQRGAGVRGMIGFGTRSGFGSLTALFYSHLPVLFLAKLAGPVSVGFFNRGDALFRRPFEQALYPIGQLLLPSMSAAAHEIGRLQYLVAQATWMLTLSIGPLIAFMVVFGDWTAVVLLGPQWAEAGEVVRWMAVVALGVTYRRPLAGANAALGRPARGVWLKLALLPIFIGVILWSAPQGAVAMVAAMAAFHVAMLPAEIAVLLRGTALSRARVLSSLAMSLSVIGLTCASLLALRGIWPDVVRPEAPGLLDLLELTGLFIAAYLCAVCLACAFPEARGMIRAVGSRIAARIQRRYVAPIETPHEGT